MTERSLVLLRHAKAGHRSGVPDVERALTARGHADAGVAGAWLGSRGTVPDLVLCSPSRRTRETWHAVAIALGAQDDGPAVRYEPQLYEGAFPDLVELIEATEPTVGTVLVIGHNPAMSMLSALLDPASAASDGLRTCGLAVHRVQGGWPDCGPGRAPLVAAHTARA
jgi:phosphohistidine phosphatase